MSCKNVLALLNLLPYLDYIGTIGVVSATPAPFQDIPFYYVSGDPFKDVAEQSRRIREEGLQSYAFHTMSVAGKGFH